MKEKIINLITFIVACLFLYGGCQWLTKDRDEFASLYEQCQKACENEDFQEAHNLLGKIKSLDYYKDETQKAEDYVFNKEALFLISKNDSFANERLIYLFSEIQRPIEPLPEGIHEKEVKEYSTIHDEDDNEKTLRYEIPKIIDLYNNEAERYNVKCNKVLEIAAQQNNKRISEFIINSYVRQAVVTDVVDTTIVKTKGTKPTVVYSRKKKGMLKKIMTLGSEDEYEDEAETIMEEYEQTKELLKSHSFILEYHDVAKEAAFRRYPFLK